jgi:hypothetical protein
MHNPPKNCNFHDERVNAIMPRIIQDYSWLCRRRGENDEQLQDTRLVMEVEKKHFFNIYIDTVLNSSHFLTLCGAQMTRRQFRLALLWNLIEEAGSIHCLGQPRWRPVVLEKEAAMFVVNFSNHFASSVLQIVLPCLFCTKVKEESTSRV